MFGRVESKRMDDILLEKGMLTAKTLLLFWETNVLHDVLKIIPVRKF